MYNSLIKPILKYGSEECHLYLVIAKRWLVLKERFLGCLEQQKCWRERCNIELENVFGDVDLASFIKINGLK